MRTERGTRQAVCATAAPGPAVEAPGSTPTPELQIILAGVKTLLRSRGSVTLVAAGLDLVFDAGVVARCRACGLSWRVSRNQFGSAGWWSCPSGCRFPRIDEQQP